MDRGKKPGITSEDKRRITELEWEVGELRRANEILKAAAAFFARSSTGAESGDRVCRGVWCDVGAGLQGAAGRPGHDYAARSRQLSARDQRDEQPSLHRRITASSPVIRPPCLSVGWVDDCGPVMRLWPLRTIAARRY